MYRALYVAVLLTATMAAAQASQSSGPNTVVSPVDSIFTFLCLVLMVHSVVRSHRKLRTVLYGVLAIAGTLGVIQVLVTISPSLNNPVMGVVALMLCFIIPAYVMRTHSRSTKAMVPKPDAAGGSVG